MERNREDAGARRPNERKTMREALMVIAVLSECTGDFARRVCISRLGRTVVKSGGAFGREID